MALFLMIVGAVMVTVAAALTAPLAGVAVAGVLVLAAGVDLTRAGRR